MDRLSDKTLLGIFYLVRLRRCPSSTSVVLSQYQNSPHWKGCWTANSVVKTSLQAQRGLICQLPKNIFRFSSHSGPEAFYPLSMQKQPNQNETGNTHSTISFEEKVDISLYIPIQGRTASVFVSRPHLREPGAFSGACIQVSWGCSIYLCHGWQTHKCRFPSMKMRQELSFKGVENVKWSCTTFFFCSSCYFNFSKGSQASHLSESPVPCTWYHQ